MTSLDHRRLSDEVASRRNLLIGGLVAASTLAPFPITTTAAHAQGAIRSQKPPSAGLQKASFVRTKDGTDIFYKEWGTGVPVVFSHGWPPNADAWDDQNVPIATTAQVSSKLIKNAMLGVYPGAPHGLTVTRRNRFNGELLTLVKGLN